jgi:hypothetical protein
LDQKKNGVEDGPEEMRILLVAMSESIHTARWISQITGQGWDIHLFPSIDNGVVHPAIKDVTVYHSFYDWTDHHPANVRRCGYPVITRRAPLLGRGFIRRHYPEYRVAQLQRTIRKIKPDLVHSLEIQHAGYLTLEVKKRLMSQFPPWIVTNWGSDIYLFGRLAKHKSPIRQVLSLCDFYSCECQRDVDLARAFDFQGEIVSVFPNGGGFALDEVRDLRAPGKPSERKWIALKGYQNWSGRALIGLRALERCARWLGGYEVKIYSAPPEVEIAAELFSDATGIKTEILPERTPHQDILRMFGKARIAIGLSISDAISTSLLEAIIMGAYPIQSWTSCANEWIDDGINGSLVPPEDPDAIEEEIRKSLINDDLIDRAAEINWKKARQRLEASFLKEKAIQMYEYVKNRTA